MQKRHMKNFLSLHQGALKRQQIYMSHDELWLTAYQYRHLATLQHLQLIHVPIVLLRMYRQISTNCDTTIITVILLKMKKFGFTMQ